MTKHKVGIDLDGVCADFCGTRGLFRKMSIEMFGRPDPPDKVQTDWDWPWLTKEEEDKLWTRVNETENFWSSLETESGVNLLRDAQRYFDLYFITNREKRVPVSGPSVEQQSMAWVKKKFDIEYPQVLVTKRKGDIAEALELYAFIDDKPSNCQEVYDGTLGQTKVFIRDQTYNKEASRLFIRVPTLDAMLEALS